MFRDKTSYALLIVYLLFYAKSVAQSSIATPSNLLPTITAPSPEAPAFARYSNDAANLFNEIKVGQLKSPVSIGYNTSGVKGTDTATCIGPGWSMNKDDKKE